MNDWINIKHRLPPRNGNVRVLTYAGAVARTLFEDGEFDYDLACEESVSMAGMGLPDKVLYWAWVNRKIPEYIPLSHPQYAYWKDNKK